MATQTSPTSKLNPNASEFVPGSYTAAAVANNNLTSTTSTTANTVQGDSENRSSTSTPTDQQRRPSQSANSQSGASPSNKQNGLLPSTGAKGGWEAQQQQQQQDFSMGYQYGMAAANLIAYPGYVPHGAYVVNYMNQQQFIPMGTYYNPQTGEMQTLGQMVPGNAGDMQAAAGGPQQHHPQSGRKNPNLRGPRTPTGKGVKGGKGFGKGKGGKGAAKGAAEGKGAAYGSANGRTTPTKSVTPEKKEPEKIDLSGPSLAVSAAIAAAGKKLDKEALKHLEEEEARKEAERKKEEEEEKPKVMNWAAKLKATTTTAAPPAVASVQKVTPKVVVAKTPTVMPRAAPTKASAAATNVEVPKAAAMEQQHVEEEATEAPQKVATVLSQGPSWADRAKQQHHLTAPSTAIGVTSPLVVTTKPTLMTAKSHTPVVAAHPTPKRTPASGMPTPRTVVATPSPTLPKHSAPAVEEEEGTAPASPPVSPRKLKGAWAARASRTPVTKPADKTVTESTTTAAAAGRPSALTAAADLAAAKAKKEEVEVKKAEEEERIAKEKEEATRKAEEEEAKRVAEERAAAAAEEEAAAAAEEAAAEEAARKAEEEERVAKEKRAEEEAKRKAEEEAAAAEAEALAAATAARESEESEKTAREENEEEVTASEGYDKEEEEQEQQQQEQQEQDEDDEDEGGYTPSATPNYDAVLDYQHYTLDFLRSLRDLPECQELPDDHNIPAQILKNSRIGHMKNHKGDEEGMDWRKDAERHRSMRHKEGRRKGGKSGRHSDRPPRADPNEYVEPLQHSESSWATQQKLKLEQSGDEKVERHIIAILNKLTVEKFDKLVNQLQSPETGICKQEHIKALVDRLFEKATTQHHFIPMYADVCQRTVIWLKQSPEPVLEDVDAGKAQVEAFKNVLLNTCQHEFESNLNPPAELTESGLQGEELQEAEIRYKTRMLGNIKFVAQLVQRKLISSKIAIVCINQMWERKYREECIEALCVFLRETGPVFDNPKWSHYTEFAVAFDRLKEVTKDADHYSSRIRFMCQDILDLRAHRWVDPKKDNGPLTISEVHRQVELERAETERFSRQNSRSGGNDGGRGGLNRSRTGFGSSSKLDRRGGGLQRTISRGSSIPHGLSSTNSSRPGTAFGSRGSLPARPTPAPWGHVAARATQDLSSRSAERSSSPSSDSRSVTESKPSHHEDPAKQVKSTLEELSASLDVDNAVQELADISATPEEQTKILLDRIGASCDIKKEQRQAHLKALGKLFSSEKKGTWETEALEKALDEFADPEIIDDMKLDIPNIADIFVGEVVKTLQDYNIFTEDKVATYANRLNVNL
ncbi:hypothetical protein FOL47_006346 [Perkinsus chesapeaki]|uniref:MIF4G domain-containing protein n=1 Tax=Perkinsus chesapeaki TaxID=330153 RepID=A0A7J6LSI0_PERCH|nr:hypothetical protein FOL47_006346 [Perkinsus chesapeaki]